MPASTPCGLALRPVLEHNTLIEFGRGGFVWSTGPAATLMQCPHAELTANCQCQVPDHLEVAVFEAILIAFAVGTALLKVLLRMALNVDHASDGNAKSSSIAHRAVARGHVTILNGIISH
jgi:hypothetical protein